MLLAVDAGNTETKLGCFDSGEGKLIQAWRITTRSERTADELGVLFTELFAAAKLRPSDVSAVAIASVVPNLDAVLGEMSMRYFGREAIFFKAHRQQLMRIGTERPGEVGADLVAAAIGAKEIYGAPLIIISYGTATVFMAIDADGLYLGVAIAPGINISIEALVERTAKLPQIALEAPGKALGTDTISALQSGIIYGFVGQTEALVARIRKELGVDAKVIATGGMAEVVAKHTGIIGAVNPHLSLFGLRSFYLCQK
ncbi:MAG TPA: type III pantothenate kinase [Candidatus Rubrimentiphilum sp.]|nr:type III pantothenate kinase [Candidatus Rubrimentiphilum sp.]